MFRRCLDCDRAIETNSGKFCRLFGYPCAKIVACQDTDYPFSAVNKPATTNADRIRSMTDEELAAWLFHHSMVCVPGKRPNPEDCVGGCEHCWLDWLREEGEL